MALESFDDWVPCLPYILFLAISAMNAVNQVTAVACDIIFACITAAALCTDYGARLVNKRAVITFPVVTLVA